MKILVAEDEPLLLKTIEMRLKKEGYEVILAADGREAMQQIDVGQPDLIITDIMMPFASGLEIIGKVKQNDAENIPVIILSAMGQENTVLEAFNLGADDYVTKPFSPNELVIRIKRITGNRSRTIL